jgi:hypothetical protein
MIPANCGHAFHRQSVRGTAYLWMRVAHCGATPATTVVMVAEIVEPWVCEQKNRFLPAAGAAERTRSHNNKCIFQTLRYRCLARRLLAFVGRLALVRNLVLGSNDAGFGAFGYSFACVSYPFAEGFGRGDRMSFFDVMSGGFGSAA